MIRSSLLAFRYLTLKFIRKVFKLFGLHVYTAKDPHAHTLMMKIYAKMISQSSGILHIGGHFGQEAVFYSSCGRPVLWIEANPRTFEILKENLRTFKEQRCLLALLGDRSVENQPFRLASNDGASSSIYEFVDSHNLGVEMLDTINLPMVRLDGLITKSQVKKHNFWVIDVQGAELKVLEGAGRLLDLVLALAVEVKRNSFYKDGAEWVNVKRFLHGKGFTALWEPDQEEEMMVMFVRLESKDELKSSID